ncbi:MAG: hypothetical protein ABI867_11235 [Kofleriaceae bacterium]
MNTTKTETKTETPQTPPASPPKADNPFAAFAAFDPMTSWTASQQMFAKAMTDAYGRAQAFADQYAALEAQFVSRAQGAVATWSQLTQDAIAYSAQLSAEARKLGFEAARRAGAGA